MSKNPFTVEENTLISDILLKMNKKKLQMHVFIKKNKKDYRCSSYS